MVINDMMVFIGLGIICCIMGVYSFQMISKIITDRQNKCNQHSWQHYRKCINCGLKQVQESKQNE
jgi:hypothetical protein